MQVLGTIPSIPAAGANRTEVLLMTIPLKYTDCGFNVKKFDVDGSYFLTFTSSSGSLVK